MSSHPDAPERALGRRTVLFMVAVMGALAIAVFTLAAVIAFGRLPDRGSSRALRPTPAIVEAVRDIVRLETTELHIEKVIDLTDKQSRFFGLVSTTDAVLLVASGEVTIGIDLAKLRDDDIQIDERTGVVRIQMPTPEILDVHLDEKMTYVYKRTTSLFAERNERLESRARVEAVASIERAARETDALDRSKRTAERQVRVLLQKLGVPHVEVGWRAAS